MSIFKKVAELFMSPHCFACRSKDYNLYYVGVCKKCFDEYKKEGIIRRVGGATFSKVSKKTGGKK